MDPERPARRPTLLSPYNLDNPRKSRFLELDVDYLATTPPPFDESSLWQLDEEDAWADAQETWLENSSNKRYRNSVHRKRPSLALRADSSTIRQIINGTSYYTRLLTLACTMVITIPLLFNLPSIGMAGPTIMGVKAGPIRERRSTDHVQRLAGLEKRQDSTTDVCNRWSHQSALVNGTIYIYGGRTSQQPNQASNTWTNDFVSMDITKNFDIADPPLTGLPQPSGAPAVSNGYLWNSYDSLYLYGGEYSDSPPASPDAYSLWVYDLKSSSWSEKNNPKTSPGNNSDGGNQPVQRAAEGAGISIPELGRGFYFAGHLDLFTTKGWSLYVPRVYLKSLIEFTFPGYANSGVKSLQDGSKAGDDGVWRNITQGGIQDSARFTSRADSALVYVPGYGAQGILLSLGGGNNESFSQMNVIDVYDIATSTWYKQSTSDRYPILRVNPCAVAASAADGSSTNIYMYGGQNLIPADNQTQYGDMWILTVPSFTWIEVDTSTQSQPPARVGHTCNMYNGQMIVIGGYTGKDLGCDNGFYVFNTSELTWQNTYTALSGADPQNQQDAQRNDPMGLIGSYGYQVPGAVQSVIGGHASGGATVTAPAKPAASGPLATGKPVTYTVTGADGAVATEVVGSTNNGNGGGSSGNGGKSGPNIGAIVAGVVAGLFAILAAYLGFCAWVYRRQLRLYKNHVTMTQRHAAGTLIPEKSPFLSSTNGSSGNRGGASTSGGSSGPASGNPSLPPVPGLPQEHSENSATVGKNTNAHNSVEDLMSGQEPSFVGVLLNPRRSLRVINRD